MRIPILYLVIGFACCEQQRIVCAQDASVVTPSAYSVASPNSVQVWSPKRIGVVYSELTPGVDYLKCTVTNQYFDGLGRPIQTVEKHGAYSYDDLWFYDKVTPVVYDNYGRIQRHYLPYHTYTNCCNGNFRMNPFAEQNHYHSDASGDSPVHGQGETYYYGKTEFEPSPLNRVARVYAPGSSFVHDGRGTTMSYLVNTATDDVRIWNVTVSNSAGTFSTYSSNGSYPAGDLTKDIVTDEDNKQVVTFKDKEGKVILKKVQHTSGPDTGSGSGHAGWLCTYYLYDSNNLLRAVLQPEGVVQMAGNYTFTSDILNRYTFRYEYDGKRRTIVKKVPGAGEVYMVYDKRDRLVLMQDANMRNGSPVKWLYTLYDAVNRPVATGLWQNSTALATHTSSAGGSISYPDLTGQTHTVLTKTFYDNYAWRSSEGNPLSASYDKTWDSHLFAYSNTTLPYADKQTTASTMTKGLVTGTMVNVLGTSTNLYAVNIYDDKSRLIQVQSQNVTGGSDVLTRQYDYTGKQLLMTVEKQEKSGTNAQTTVVITKYGYSVIGAFLSAQSKISNSLINGGAMSNYRSIFSQWRLTLDGKPRLRYVFTETQNIDYNMRGWILGVNRSYAKAPGSTTSHFGYDLCYEKPSLGAIGAYSASNYNGNISGMVWKSAGNNKINRYDYTYDASNRLSTANFNQHVTGSTWSQAQKNFTVNNLTYDANGNIMTLNRKTGAGSNMDILGYTYEGNRLIKVDDGGDPARGFVNGSTATTEYAYDDNGNMTIDQNKGIINGGAAAITYNHLNLPYWINVAGKGNMDYVYTATGQKLKQVVHETGKPDKTTLYLGSAVYENDVLQYILHDEGRVVRKLDNTLAYEYFLKDHLGNTRMVLTSSPSTTTFPASFESETATQEEALYGYLPQTRVPFIAADANSDGGKEVVRLNAAKPSGASLTLPVMAGDTIDMKVYAYYEGGSGYSATSNLTAFVTAVAAAFGGINGGSPAEQARYNVINNAYTGGSAGMLGTPSDNVPAAYINYILFDEDMISYQFGYKQITSAANFGHGLISINDVIAAKRGFAYVYLTNESLSGQVYFDDIQVKLKEGRIVQENDYEPFGLTFNSYQRENSIPNRLKFQEQEHIEDLGLNWDSFKWRNHQPDIGRFFNIDPLADKYVYNSPYAFAENRVIDGRELEGLEWVNAKGQQIYDPKANDGKGGYTQYATKNEQTLGNSLRKTQAGQQQFDKLVGPDQKTKVLLNEGPVVKDSKGRYELGKTSKNPPHGKFDVYINFDTKKYEVDILESTVTINVNTVSALHSDAQESEQQIGNVKFGSEISFTDLLGVVFGHEIEHTTDENATINQNKGDMEKPAYKVSDAMLNELKEKNRKANE